MKEIFKKFSKVLYYLGAFFLIIFVLSVVFTKVVDGESMYPTLKNEQLIFINIADRAPETNDIVVIMCKNGKCSTSKNCLGCDDVLVKRLTKKDGDNWWVEGDNKDNSWDSRDFGWITPEDRIYYGSVMFTK
jgi:signal peptidase I